MTFRAQNPKGVVNLHHIIVFVSPTTTSIIYNRVFMTDLRWLVDRWSELIKRGWVSKRIFKWGCRGCILFS